MSITKQIEKFIFERLLVILGSIASPIFFLLVAWALFVRIDNQKTMFFLKSLLLFPLFILFNQVLYYFQAPSILHAVNMFFVAIPFALIETFALFITYMTVTSATLYTTANGLIYGLDRYKEAMKEAVEFLQTIALRNSDGNWIENDAEWAQVRRLFNMRPRVQANDIFKNIESDLYQRKQNRLSELELAAAKGLLVENTAHLTVEQKTQLKNLTIKCMQYEDLNTRLTQLHEALKQESLDGLEDELMVYCPLVKPIFLTKQYQDQGHWYSIPAAGKITDKINLSAWVNMYLIHPANKDPITAPKLHEDKPTRYIWHDLSIEYCYAEELGECADKIRELTRELNALTKAPPESQASSLIAYSLLRPKHAVPQDKSGPSSSFSNK